MIETSAVTQEGPPPPTFLEYLKEHISERLFVAVSTEFLQEGSSKNAYSPRGIYGFPFVLILVDNNLVVIPSPLSSANIRGNNSPVVYDIEEI